MTGLAAAVGGAAVALVLTPLAARLARRVGLFDHPGPFKVHREPVPYLGGVAVLGSVLLGAALGRPILAVPAGIAFAVGLLDDARPLSPHVRLLGATIAGVVLAAATDVEVAPVVGGAAVVLATVILINGINMIDGLDGLAGSVTLVSAVAFAILLDGDGRVLALALTGGTAGFLVFNRPPARVYLGDAGAYLIGATLAVLLALAWSPAEAAEVRVGSLLLVAIPAAEVALSVIRRARSGSAVVAGDRGHLYDRLAYSGRPLWVIIGTYLAAQAVIAAIGFGAAALPVAGAIVAVIAVAAGILAVGAATGFLASVDPAAGEPQ